MEEIRKEVRMDYVTACPVVVHETKPVGPVSSNTGAHLFPGSSWVAVHYNACFLPPTQELSLQGV